MAKKSNVRVLLAQLHLKVGVTTEVLEYNCAQIREAFAYGKANNCDLVLCPELAVSGYSPGDLLLRPDVQTIIDETTNKLTEEFLSAGKDYPAILFGSARRVSRKDQDNPFPQGLHSKTSLDDYWTVLANAVMVVDPNARKVSEVYKTHLPNWGVFDEIRWFAAASQVAEPIEINGVKVGIAVCRDIWKESSVEELVGNGAEIILVPNASPYANARYSERTNVISSYAKKYGVPIAYVNMIQGCDEVVFDGGSFAVSNNGDIVVQGKRFEQGLLICDLPIGEVQSSKNSEELVLIDQSGSLGHDEFFSEEAYKTIVLGTREFMNAVDPNSRVAIGLSGGIDSALVATIAVDALGADRVVGVLMPSKFTSNQSIEDSHELAKRLGIETRTISIENMHDFATKEFKLDDMAEIVSENIQPRLRAMVLMMLSNSEGLLPLATSNKSEGAVGYCTLYGDTVGAYAPIKDIYKTQVYAVCEWRNATTEYSLLSPIPDEIIVREPTAELKEHQVDEDSLLPYEILDVILEKYIDIDLSIEEIIADGFVESDVRRIIGLVNASEFKRKQMPVGPRLSRRNFGLGRRIPISVKI